MLRRLSLQPACLLLPSASRVVRQSTHLSARAPCILSNTLQLAPCVRAAMHFGSRPLPLSGRSASFGSSPRTLLSPSEQSKTLCLHSERLPTHIGAGLVASSSAYSTAAPQQQPKKGSSKNAGKQTDWLAGEAHRKSRHSRTQLSRSRGPRKPQERQLHTETAADTRQFYNASEQPPKRSTAQSMAAFQQKQQHAAAQQCGDPQLAAAAPGTTAAAAQATADTGPTHVQRKSGVTDVPWDRHDTHTVSEALQDGLREEAQQGTLSCTLFFPNTKGNICTHAKNLHSCRGLARMPRTSTRAEDLHSCQGLAFRRCSGDQERSKDVHAENLLTFSVVSSSERRGQHDVAISCTARAVQSAAGRY